MTWVAGMSGTMRDLELHAQWYALSDAGPDRLDNTMFCHLCSVTSALSPLLCHLCSATVILCVVGVH